MASLCLIFFSVLSLIFSSLCSSLALHKKVEEKVVCVPEIFAFADSLSDTGNLCTAAPNLCLAGQLPYGQNFPHGPTGRFSNGLNILDCISTGFGLPLIDPYFQTVGGNFTHGLNFANAGCTASFVGSLAVPAPARNPFDFGAQVEEFRRVQRIIQRRYALSNVDFKLLPKPKSFSRALYYVEIGGNDINYNNLGGQSESELDNVVIPKVMFALSSGINQLVKYGARHFLIFGLPAQGCASINLSQGKVLNPTPQDFDELGCLNVYNRISVTYNQRLMSIISELRHNHTDCAFIYANYFAVHQAILNGTLGSFTNRTNLKNACCGVKGFDYNCPSPPSPSLGCQCNINDVCPDPDDYIMWDGIHFTEAFSKVAAAAFLQPNSPYLDTGDGVRLKTRC